MIGAETGQRRIASSGDVLGAPVDERSAGLVAAHAELGGDRHLVAVGANGIAQDRLTGVAAVVLGGVEEGHAQVERSMDRGGELLGRHRPVPGGEGHSTHAYCRHGRPVGTQLPLFHPAPPIVLAMWVRTLPNVWIKLNRWLTAFEWSR